jgi:hypothetical protein
VNQYSSVTASCPECNWIHRVDYNPRKHWDTKTRARFGLRLHLEKIHKQTPAQAWENALLQFPEAK